MNDLKYHIAWLRKKAHNFQIIHSLLEKELALARIERDKLNNVIDKIDENNLNEKTKDELKEAMASFISSLRLISPNLVDNVEKELDEELENMVDWNKNKKILPFKIKTKREKGVRNEDAK